MEMKLIIISISLIILVRSSRSEYKVEGGSNSYLEYNGTNVAEDNFPRKIQIELFITVPNGTLLYSYDRNNNQFIVSLNNTKITIRYRNQASSYNLDELCSCSNNCFNSIMALTILITKSTTGIRCTNDFYKIKEFSQKKTIDKAYPIFHFNSNISHNQAILRILNYDSNSKSPSVGGCIFNIKYNGEDIKLKTVGKVISPCPRSCTPNACNGRKCIENYSTKPNCFPSPLQQFKSTSSTSRTVSKVSLNVTSSAVGKVTNSDTAVITIAIAVSLIPIIIIGTTIVIMRKYRSYERIKKSRNSEEVPLQYVYTGNGDSAINVILYGLNYNETKQIAEVLPKAANYITYINDIYKTKVMDSINECKLIVMILNIDASKLEMYEFMYKIMMMSGKTIFPLVITPDGNIYNDIIEDCLKDNEYLMKFNNMDEMMDETSKTEINKTVTKILSNPVESVPPTLENVQQNIIFVIDSKTNGIISPFIQSLQNKLPNYPIIVDSHSDSKQYGMIDNINKAKVVVHFCQAKLNVSFQHAVMYEYCEQKNKLIIPVIINYVDNNVSEFSRKLLNNEYKQFIQMDGGVNKDDINKLVTDIVDVIEK